MQASSLTRCVGELPTAGAFHQTRNRVDVDHARAIARSSACSLREKWEKSHGGIEVARDISLECVGPGLLFDLEEVLRDVLCAFHIWLSRGRELGRVIASYSGIVH